MKKETTQLAFGIPAWDLYSCDICGAALFKHTISKHQDFHNTPGNMPETKHMPKDCPICGETIDIPLDFDGAMILDEYDDHMESHEQ